MKKEEIENMQYIMLKSEKWHDEESEERRIYEEMCCRSMIMSCLIYGDDIYTDDYVKQYCDILGDQRVLELCKDQEEYFKNHVIVKKDVYIDGDGISYNSIIEY